MLTRTQVCQALGISPKTLYLWERHGRIPAPRRTARGWRAYSEKDVAPLRADEEWHGGMRQRIGRTHGPPLARPCSRWPASARATSCAAPSSRYAETACCARSCCGWATGRR